MDQASAWAKRLSQAICLIQIANQLMAIANPSLIQQKKLLQPIIQ